MAIANTCSHCGADLPADSPGGHCVRCILLFALDPDPDPAAGPEAASQPDAPGAAATAASEDPHGFDRYRLIAKLGEGGCGVVYRAEQLRPIQREVALKVIKPGMDTRSVIARFEAERQALALMDHPGIAKVLDAGIAANGRSFFVMELVRGERITDYCDQRQLSLRERLRLFVEVCHAVQHAHQKGVIHRDLKPSNILVTEHDRVPVPKVIDFGVAKATGQQRLDDQTVFTAFEQFIGTPAYMSPEQAGFGGLDVDTRSDIYSLGVLLYELLTGMPPFDARRLQHAAIDEVFRLIREEEPALPSTRLAEQLASSAKDSNPSAADRRPADESGSATPEDLSRRRTQLQETRNLLRGDLDCIVMKAIEKDRTRRYETADGLGVDLQHFLNDEPVIARRPSALYRLRKFARRNRVGFTAALLILVALLAGLIVSLHLLAREAEARQLAVAAGMEQRRLREQAQAAEDSARMEAARSGQIAAFLAETFRSVNPGVARGRDTSLLRDAITRASMRVDRSLKDQPELQGDLCRILGEASYHLGDYTNAVELHFRALGLRQAVLPREHPLVADSLYKTAEALVQLGRWTEAETHVREAVAINRKLPGARRALASSLGLLAICARTAGRVDEAEALRQETLATAREMDGATSLRVANNLHEIGSLKAMRGQLSEAEDLMRQSLTMIEQIDASDSVMLAHAWGELGRVLQKQGRTNESAAAWTRATQMRTRLLGENHPITVSSRATLETLNRIDIDQIKLWSRDPLLVGREIETLLNQLETEGSLPTEPLKPVSVRLMLLLGMLEHNHGNPERSEEYFRQTLLRAEPTISESWGYYLPHIHIAYYLQEQHRWADAEAYFRQAIAIRRSSTNTSPDHLAHNYLALAYPQLRQGRFEAGDATIREGWKVLETIPPGTEAGGGPMLETVRVLSHLSQLTDNPGWSNDYMRMAFTLVPRLSGPALKELTYGDHPESIRVREQMRQAGQLPAAIEHPPLSDDPDRLP